MNPFKGVSGGRRKRKKSKVEVKEEPVIKEEPMVEDGGVDSVSRTTVDGRYRTTYDGPLDSTCDFDEVKSEIKFEKETKGEEKESTHCEGSNVSTTKKSTTNVS